MNITPSVSIKLEVKQSDIPVKGNAMASGDDKYDRKVENQILKRLENGDISAWFDCVVTVSIEWDDLEYSAYDSLGACSYASIKEFVKASDYFKDMVDNAYDQAITAAYHDGITDKFEVNLEKIKPVICEC